MKCTWLIPGLFLVALVACLTQASPSSRSQEEIPESDIAILAHDLPVELRDLYDVIVDPSQDDIKKENCIWQAFELLSYKKFEHYVWFYGWLVIQSGWHENPSPGRHTPRQGGITPRGGPGGRTHGHRGGPGGRTQKRGGPGGRTHRRGGKHHGRH